MLLKRYKIYEKVKLGLSNVTKIETPLQVASKNFAKIPIYPSVYISLNSRIVASKISDKPQTINSSLNNL